VKVVYLGDIMGRSGRKIVAEKLPEIKERLKPDFIVVNGENAAAGFGITSKIVKELFEMGLMSFRPVIMFGTKKKQKPISIRKNV